MCLDESFNNLKFIVTSQMRLDLLLILCKGPKNLEELREILNKSSINILKGLKELREADLVVKNDKIYSISVTGQLAALNIRNLFKNWCIAPDKNQFLESHYLDSLPPKFIKNISYWDNAQLIKSDNVDFAKAINVYLNNISKSKTIKVILPIFSKTYTSAIFNTILSKEDSNLEIISTEDIYSHLLKGESKDNIIKLKEQNKIKMWVSNQPLDFFFTTTDIFSSLFLFLNDRSFDDSSVIINTDSNQNKNLHSFFIDIKKHCNSFDIE